MAWAANEHQTRLWRVRALGLVRRLVLDAEVVHRPDVHTAAGRGETPIVQTTEPYVWPVVGEHLDTLNAISSGLALLQSRLGGSADLPAPADIIATEYPEDNDVLGPIRLLAEILVGEVANAHADEARNAEQSEAIAAIHTALEKARLRVGRRARGDALGDAGELLREMGLEFHETSSAPLPWIATARTSSLRSGFTR